MKLSKPLEFDSHSKEFFYMIVTRKIKPSDKTELSIVPSFAKILVAEEPPRYCEYCKCQQV
jgi:hypothetical protein